MGCNLDVKFVYVWRHRLQHNCRLLALQLSSWLVIALALSLTLPQPLWKKYEKMMTRGKVQFWFMVTNLGHQCHHHEGHDYLSGVFVLPCCPGMTSGIMWRTYRRKDPPNPIPKNTNPSHARWSHELCNFPQEMFALIGREKTVCWTLLPAVGWLNHTSKEFKAQFPCTSMYVKGLWLIASLSLTTCFDLRHRCCLATITFAGCSAHLRFLEVTSCQLLTTGNLSVYIQAVPMFSKFLDIKPGYLKFPPRPPPKKRYILWTDPIPNAEHQQLNNL